MNSSDNSAYDEGFTQSYRAIRGNTARLPPRSANPLKLKDRTPMQCGIIAGIAAAIELSESDAAQVAYSASVTA